MFNKGYRAGLFNHVCCFVLFFVATSASFHGYFEQVHFWEAGVPGDWAPLSFERMVDGTADRPYVYRQLVPTIANFLDQVVPPSIKTRLYVRQGNFPKAYINTIALSPTTKNQIYFFRYWVIYAVTFLFALLAVYAMYFIGKTLSLPPVLAAFSSVIFILLIPYIQSGEGTFYDFSELAFLALAVWFALNFQWWLLIPVAVFGAWNKESFLFFIPTLYPFFRSRSSRMRSLTAVGILCSICALIYFRLRLQYASNPGSTVYVQWMDQLKYFLHPRNLIFANTEIYGLRVPMVYTVFPMCLIIWAFLRGWRFLPSVIKQHGKIAASINIPLFALFCTPGEMRDLSMLYVVFFMIIAVNLNQWYGENMKNDKTMVSERP